MGRERTSWAACSATGKVPFVIPQRFVTFLKMERHGVINAIANVVFGQVGTQVISLRGPDGELVIDMGIPGRHHWKGNAIIQAIFVKKSSILGLRIVLPFRGPGS